MIAAAKALAKRHWPALRLRTILFGVLLLVAALPGVSALFLRVYENTLVRQTQAELIAQGAALAATAQALWPGAPPNPPPPHSKGSPDYQPESLSLDLGSTRVLPERPRATAAGPPEGSALAAAATLAPIFRETSRTTLASIVLTDDMGRVLLGAERGGGYADLPEVRAALAGVPQTVLRRNGDYRPRYHFEWLSRASDLRIHYARPILRNGRVLGVVLLSRSPRALFRGIYQDKGKILLGIGLISAALVVLSGLVSRGITRPVEALSDASRRVAAGHGTVPETPSTAAIEIRALYEDFRAMAAAIERRSSYLRDFAAAVSHEFKTPLAGIRGAVELLQDHLGVMSKGERQRFLGNIAADTGRLSQLVTRLLDMARADMTRGASGAAFELAPALAQTVDAFRSDDLLINLRAPSTLPRVTVPPVAVETVLTTLFDNSRQAGATRLEIDASVSAHAVTLAVLDDGPGISDADRVRVFEPFFTTRRNLGGTGMGLSIARSILSAHQGAIRSLPSREGALFEVELLRS